MSITTKLNITLSSGKPVIECEENQVLVDNVCVDIDPVIEECKENEELVGNVCKEKCNDDEERNQDGICVKKGSKNQDPECKENEELVGDICKEKCKENEERNNDGVCIEKTQDIPDTGANNNTDSNATSSNTGFFTAKDSSNLNGNTSNSPFFPTFFLILAIILVLAALLPKLIRKLRINPAFQSKYKYFGLTSLTLASISLVISVLSTSSAEFIKDIELNITASETVSKSFSIIDTDELALVHDVISIPESAKGYKLYITAESTDLIDKYNPDNKIPSISEAGKLTENSLGVYIGKTAPTIDSTFLPIYTDGVNEYSVYSTEEIETEAEELDVWYGIRAKTAKESTYSISLKLEAFGYREDIMQDITPEICASLEIGNMDLYKFKDLRDGKTYSVARMKDGNCWMLENLDLDLSPDVVLTSELTDLPEGETWRPSIATSTNAAEEWGYGNAEDGYCSEEEKRCSDKTYSFDAREIEPTEDNLNPKKLGNFYNIFAASAGTVKATMENDNEEGEFPKNISYSTPTASICPKGWYMADTERFDNLALAYGAAKSIEYITDPELVEKYISKIPNFTDSFTGVYNLYDWFGDIEYGYIEGESGKNHFGAFQLYPTPFVTAKQYYDDGHYEIEFNKESSSSGRYIPLLGLSVRCIVEVGNSTVNFYNNLNDDEEPEETIFPVENHEVEVTIPLETPENPDHIFAGWSTEKDGEVIYRPGEKFKTTSPEINLYAVWLDTKVAVKDEETGEILETIDLNTMQGLTEDICRKLEEEKEYGLIDVRDNKVYSISRLKDGNCWMTQNLALELTVPTEQNPDGGARYLNPETGEEEITSLTPENTDLAENMTFIPSASTETYPGTIWDTTPTSRSIKVGKDYYYNWYTTTTTKTLASQNTIATASICPKGWELPSTSDHSFLATVYQINKIEEAPTKFSRNTYNSTITDDYKTIDNNPTFWLAGPTNYGVAYPKQSSDDDDDATISLITFSESKTDKTGNLVRCIFHDTNRATPKALLKLNENNKYTLTFLKDQTTYTPVADPTLGDTVSVYDFDDLSPDNYRIKLHMAPTGINPKPNQGVDRSKRAIIESIIIDRSFSTFSPSSTQSWFAGFTGIKEFSGLTYLNTSNTIRMSGMFRSFGNNDFSSLTLPEGFGRNAENMNTMFTQASLTSIFLPKNFGLNAKTIMSMFSNSSFSSLTLPEGFGRNAENMRSCFNHMKKLSYLHLPEGFGTKARDLYTSFASLESLKTLVLPDSLSDNFSENVTNAKNMFSGLPSYGAPTAIENICVKTNTDWEKPEFVDDYHHYGDMFKDAVSLPGYSSSNSNDIKNAHIGDKNGVPGYFTDKTASQCQQATEETSSLDSSNPIEGAQSSEPTAINNDTQTPNPEDSSDLEAIYHSIVAQPTNKDNNNPSPSIPSTSTAHNSRPKTQNSDEENDEDIKDESSSPTNEPKPLGVVETKTEDNTLLIVMAVASLILVAIVSILKFCLPKHRKQK